MADAVDVDRAAFEAWAQANDYPLNRTEIFGDEPSPYYLDPRTVEAWEGWQAGRMHSRQEAHEARRYRWMRDGGTVRVFEPYNDRPLWDPADSIERRDWKIDALMGEEMRSPGVAPGANERQQGTSRIPD